MTTHYVGTSTNMVHVVESIIEGYGDFGPIRSLAQEPVQNSFDAKHNSPQVSVEYRLYKRVDGDGKPYYLLTVTDTGTHGLRGPILSREELDERGDELEERENWAAFEGQGFTRKTDDSARGSRGQGKAAFLYHSVPPTNPSRRRMLMLYDTLLPTREYRLGVRNANPRDVTQSPPFLEDLARSIVGTTFSDNTDLDVELGLPPLENIGTRVIVPYLSEEAVTAIRSGELARWLQRCWWRAIQIGELEIIVDDGDGNRETIAPPPWWAGDPWEGAHPPSVVVREYPNVLVADDFLIKRIVLLFDEGLEPVDDDSGATSQFEGVQLLRAQQWISTIGNADRELSGYIPREKRAQFRGFVEFDKSLEKELRKLERPQHHSFDRQKWLVQQVYRAVEGRVEEFAREQGWAATATRSEQPRDVRDILSPLFRAFMEVPRGRVEPPEWDCQLTLDYHDSTTTRVNWGESIRDVSVEVRSRAAFVRDVSVTLEIERPGTSEVSGQRIIAERTIDVSRKLGTASFGN